MDDKAFVEWLFNPDLQVTPQQSPRWPTPSPTSPNRQSHSRAASHVVDTSNINSESSIKENPQLISKTDSEMGTSLEDDEEVFQHLLNVQEFNDQIQTPSGVESGYSEPSELLEPLPLSKRRSGSLKDTFLNLGESPVTSPTSRRLIMSLASLPPSPVTETYSVMRHSIGGFPALPEVETDRVVRHSFGGEGTMPVIPLNNNHRGSRGGILPYSGQNFGHAIDSNNSVSAIQALQQVLWSNSPAGVSHLNPDSVKHVMMAANNGSSRTTTSKPYGLNIAVNWVPTSNIMLTPTSAGPPELNRSISNVKSKARAPTSKLETRACATTAATALAASLSSVKDEVISGDDETMLLLPNDFDLSIVPKPTKGKKCIEQGCIRRAQSNSRCKAHGGGARCQYSGPGGCNRSSQGGGFCRAHGGGKRCEYPGCTRGQQRKGRCYVHGGIRKCQTEGCEKKDRGNGFCISHGGGKRCAHPGCARAVRRGTMCQQHEEETIVSMMMS